MVVLGIVVGAAYGVALAALHRCSWPVRLLVMSMALATLVGAWVRILGDPATAQPWNAGLTAFAVTAVIANVYFLLQNRREHVHH